MPQQAMVKQTIARDQTEVASKLDDLIAQNNIDADMIVDVEVEKFGANQFLILAIYYATYVFSKWLGLTPSIARKIEMSRTAGVIKAGLTVAVGRVLETARFRKPKIGLAPAAISRECIFERVLSTVIGLVVIEFEQWSWRYASPPTGLTASISVGVGRGVSAAAGLACDVGYTHVHP